MFLNLLPIVLIGSATQHFGLVHATDDDDEVSAAMTKVDVIDS